MITIAEIVLVCGGRGYRDYKGVCEVLDGMKIDCLVHGGATGADLLAGEWAAGKGKPFIVVPANWKAYGKNAGPVRNAWMLKYINVTRVVAFPGGRGTAHMVKMAREAGIPVTHVEHD